MTFIALLASSLLLSSAASAQAATRYDLNCKNKVTVMRIGSTTRETVSSPKRLSIDLAAKLWCSRHDDMTCGTTSPITIPSTQLVLNEHVFIDRRSGRSEEHTSELQSLMRTSYAVFCSQKKSLSATTHNLLNSYHVLQLHK